MYTVYHILSCNSSPVLVASNLAQFSHIPILLVYLSRKRDEEVGNKGLAKLIRALGHNRGYDCGAGTATISSLNWRF